MHLMERIMHLLRYSIVHLRETTVATVQAVTLKLLLHVHRQALLDVSGHVVTICSVSIAHREEMQAELLEHIGHEDVRVLILLVWIAGLVTYGCGESKLGNAIESLSRRLHTLALVAGCALNAILLAL